MDERGAATQPPRPPQIRQRIRLAPRQLLGLVVLGAIPALALFGLLERWTTEVVRSQVLQLRVRYAEWHRYREPNLVDVHVTNVSSRVIDTVTVAFDTAYVLRFSSVNFTPPPAGGFEIDLVAVEPGETRLVRAELGGQRYGRHEGEITVTDGAGDTARVRLSTTILP